MMSNDQELLMLSTQIIETQNKISQSLSNFPRLNPEQIAIKPIEVLSVLLRQIDFLYDQYQDSQSNNLDNDYTQMMNEKAIADCNMLRMSLAKSEDMIKSLKTEKEYYSKQLDCMRKEVEALKVQNQQLQVNISSISMFDQKQEQPLSYSSFGEQAPVDRRSSSQSKHSHSNSIGQQNQSTYQSTNNKSTQQANFQNQQLQFQVQQQDQQISTLQKDIKDLKFELQQKEDTIDLKQDQIQQLQNQIDKLKQSSNQECEKLRQDIQIVQDTVHQKEQLISKLQKSCEEMMKAHSIEIPLHQYQIVKKTTDMLQASHHNMQSIDQSQRKNDKQLCKTDKKAQQNNNRSHSQQKSAFKNKLQYMKDIYEEAQMILDDTGMMNFNQDESLRIPTNNNHNNNVGSIKKTKNKKTLQFINEPMLAVGAGAEQLIDIDEVLCNQIQAARLAEQTILDLQKDEKSNLAQFELVDNNYKELKEQLQILLKQKTDLTEQAQNVQKENDQVKAKFATLLDQFQEYVNLSEERQIQEENHMRGQSDMMVHELTQNIQELEHHLNSQQQELQQKDELYSLLKNDYNRLEAKYEEQEKQHLNFDSQKERQIQSLEEEVNYLKKHLEVEIGLIKDENEILKRELRDVNVRRLLEQNQKIMKQNPNKQQQQQQHQHSPNRDIGHYHNQEQQIMHQNVNDMHCGGTPSPFKSSSQGNLRHGYQQQDLNCSGSYNQQKVQEMVNYTQINFDKFKRDIIEKEKIIEEKNQEILRLRIAVEDSQQHQISNIRSNPEQDTMKKNIIYDIGIALGKLRQELSKSKVMLSRDNTQFERFDSNAVVHKLQNEDAFYLELQDYIQEMRTLVSLASEIGLLQQYEFERGGRQQQQQQQQMNTTNNNNINSQMGFNQVQNNKQTADLNKSYGQVNFNGNNSQQTKQQPQMNLLDQNYQIKRTADKHLKSGQINQLYEQLLSQICKVESLMQDNAILQRTLHKYETTLSELDNVLRDTENNNVILDLKKIAEQQLKEIVSLQREVEIVKFNGQPQPQVQSVQQFINQQRSLQNQDQEELLKLKKQVDDQNYQLLRFQALQSENNEIMQERQTLLQLCEDLERQVKDGHKSLEEALEKIMQLERDLAGKENEQEEIRQRITEVAELFEKKEIKQKYSFEVLCDFVFDKAKRLFGKYESALKDAKTDKNNHTQKRLGELEVENDGLRSIIMQSNFIAKEAIKRLSRMIGEQLPQIFDNQNDNYDQELRHILDRVDQAFKDLNQENFQLKDRLQEIVQQLDIYQNEVVSSKEKERRHLIHSEELLKKDVDQLKREKERLVDRNSDLALALKDMTEDYKLQKEENDRLKERLFLYEKNNSQMHSSLIFTPVRNNNAAASNSNNHQLQFTQQQMQQVNGQHQQQQQITALKQMNDITNRSSTGTLDRTPGGGQKTLITDQRSMYQQDNYDQMTDNRRENMIEKFSMLGQKMNSNQSTQKNPNMMIKDFNGGDMSTKSHNKFNMNNGGYDKFECTSSHYTDEDDDMPQQMISQHNHQQHIFSENKKKSHQNLQDFY